MLPQNKPDRIRILFDDHRLVANAGLLLPATLARHLGLRELVDHHLDLGGAPGRANTGDKMLTLVASALAGGDCIDDADALRAGGTVGVLGMYSLYPWGTASSPSVPVLPVRTWGAYTPLYTRLLDHTAHELLVADESPKVPAVLGANEHDEGLSRLAARGRAYRQRCAADRTRYVIHWSGSLRGTGGTAHTGRCLACWGWSLHLWCLPLLALSLPRSPRAERAPAGTSSA